MTKDTPGIFLVANKTFYYLETNGIRSRTYFSRLKKALMVRGLLNYKGTKEELTEERTRLMTAGEAEEKGYTIEAIYLNQHIKEVSVEDTSIKKKIAWGKKKA